MLVGAESFDFLDTENQSAWRTPLKPRDGNPSGCKKVEVQEAVSPAGVLGAEPLSLAA